MAGLLHSGAQQHGGDGVGARARDGPRLGPWTGTKAVECARAEDWDEEIIGPGTGAGTETGIEAASDMSKNVFF